MRVFTALPQCVACPRLAAYLVDARASHPTHHNRPVGPWGDPRGDVLFVGLAPGFEGANRTGRPFCGDSSGARVFQMLNQHGWAPSSEPGTAVHGACITNAVKCVPPGNQPTPAEIQTCRERWLAPELLAHPASVIVAFGQVAFASVLRVFGEKPSRQKFAHGAEVRLRAAPGARRTLLASFHPSPLNMNTGRLSQPQFEAIFARAGTLRTNP